MYQAGIKNITLYENLNITFRHWNNLDYNDITDLSCLGDVILIENESRPELKINTKISKSGKVGFEYDLKFILFGLLQSNAFLIEKLTESVYGWSMLAEFYDGTFKFYPAVLKIGNGEIKTHDEMIATINMSSSVASLSNYYDLTFGVSLIPTYRFDSTLISFDDEIYTFDYEF
jgi:hypothetical protein